MHYFKVDALDLNQLRGDLLAGDGLLSRSTPDDNYLWRNSWPGVGDVSDQPALENIRPLGWHCGDFSIDLADNWHCWNPHPAHHPARRLSACVPGKAHPRTGHHGSSAWRQHLPQRADNLVLEIGFFHYTRLTRQDHGADFLRCDRLQPHCADLIPQPPRADRGHAQIIIR